MIEYSLGSYRISINIWYLIIFLLLQTLLNELGFWQLDRAKEKQYRLAQLAKGSENPGIDLTQVTPEQLAQFQAYNLDLEVISHDYILLDNKLDKGRPGYQVLALAKEKLSGKTLLVNRGWVFAGVDRNKLPEIQKPSNNWPVSGRLYPLPEKALSTATAKVEKLSEGLRLPVLDLQIQKEIEETMQVKLQPYVLRLNESSQGALKINWAWTNMSADKHLAYAIQWFALSLALLVISLTVCIKKVKA